MSTREGNTKTMPKYQQIGLYTDEKCVVVYRNSLEKRRRRKEMLIEIQKGDNGEEGEKNNSFILHANLRMKTLAQ